jgi:DMSO reductase anchor subunit
LALGVYALGVNIIIGLYFLKVDGFFMSLIQAVVLAIGVYGIYAQSMIYRIKARPSWNRSSTTKRFFGVGYVGFLLTAFVMLLSDADRSVMLGVGYISE